eukprot:TRINITY_DN27134_c0_g1_i1.p1 TRINITY_DN27134_c0_g1~~TRINITY_DN27134_c0_g1_i1.p1  ORF type:complete len:214 (-),score=58.03 TRINITY_DN27134_c0_g1_i1:21-662(-)
MATISPALGDADTPSSRFLEAYKLALSEYRKTHSIRISEKKVEFEIRPLFSECLQMYMTEEETCKILELRAGLDEELSKLIWKRLVELLPRYFSAYGMRLRIKDQITAFNYIVSQQAQSMVAKGMPLHAPTASNRPPTPPPLSPSRLSSSEENATNGLGLESSAGVRAVLSFSTDLMFGTKADNGSSQSSGAFSIDDSANTTISQSELDTLFS